MNPNIADDLDKELPGIIGRIAADNHVSEYAANPDFMDKRLESWHQYGLLTHTRKVSQAFLSELQPLLIGWGIYSAIEKHLSECIGGIERRKLFEAGIMLHDLGKIVCLHKTGQNREHELESAKLFDADLIRGELAKYNLSQEQSNYIRYCIANHDVIGKRIRDELKHSEKLNSEYASGEEVRRMCRDVVSKHLLPLEVGLFFVCDTLGKLDGYSTNLPERLKPGIAQQPAAIRLGRTYLEEALK